MSDMFHELYSLTRGLDAATLRHKVIAGNLANLNTPGYVRYDVKFEELLREQMGSDSSQLSFDSALRSVRPQVEKDMSGPFTADGNNVTIERENGQLGRNEILYNAYAEILSLKLNQMKFVISSVK